MTVTTFRSAERHAADRSVFLQSLQQDLDRALLCRTCLQLGLGASIAATRSAHVETFPEHLADKRQVNRTAARR